MVHCIFHKIQKFASNGGNAGKIELSVNDSTGDGGEISMTSGSSFEGNAGQLLISSGNALSGQGGSVTILAGSSATSTGEVDWTCGNEWNK